jgi:hypothetical protein
MATPRQSQNLFVGRENEMEWISEEEFERRRVSPAERGRQARELKELNTLVKCGKISPTVATDLMAHITSKTAPMSLAAALLALSLVPAPNLTGRMENTPSAQSSAK